nr:MAG TPA: hypothetical protein [Bacteriophage sp.]
MSSSIHYIFICLLSNTIYNSIVFVNKSSKFRIIFILTFTH